MRTYAAELVALAPDIIVAHAPPPLAAVQQQTRSLPIVFVQVADPVGGGFVASLARPGGNTTGFTSFEDTISAKWLELLREVVPQATRVGIIRNPATGTASQMLMGAIDALASSLGVQLTVVDVRGIAEIDRAFDMLSRASIGGLIVMPDPITLVHRDRFIELAAEHKVPTVYPYRYFVAGAACFHMGTIPPTCGGERRFMSIAFSRAASQPICPCRTRQSSRWWSISVLRSGSALSCRCHC